MQVVARAPGAALGIGAKEVFQLVEQVRLGAEVAEVWIAAGGFLGDAPVHFGAVEGMEGIALDDGGIDPFTLEDARESAGDGARACAGRAGDRDDRVFDRHGSPCVSTLQYSAIFCRMDLADSVRSAGGASGRVQRPEQ